MAVDQAPPPHISGAELPSGQMYPAGQPWHTLDPGVALYLPGAHSVQTPAPAAAKLPAGQMVVAEDPAGHL